MASDPTGPRGPYTSRSALEPACDRCQAVCCVALAFDRGPSFAADKVAGERCPHLSAHDRCRIYDERAERGYRGCIGYSCYGAGQRASAARAPAGTTVDGALFGILVELHRCAWEIERALALCPPEDPMLGQELAELAQEIEARRSAPLAQLAESTNADLGARVRAALAAIGDAWKARIRTRQASLALWPEDEASHSD